MTYRYNNYGTYTFTKILGDKPKNPKPKNDQDIMIMKNMIQDITWHYKIKLPMNVHDIRARIGEINILGATVGYPLASFVAGQAIFTAHMGKK